MKVLLSIVLFAISTIATAQQTRVTPVTVTGGTIEIEDAGTDADALPPIMPEDGMSDEDARNVVMSRIHLQEEERLQLQQKIDDMMKRRFRSFYYDHLDVIDYTRP